MQLPTDKVNLTNTTLAFVLHSNLNRWIDVVQFIIYIIKCMLIEKFLSLCSQFNLATVYGSWRE